MAAANSVVDVAMNAQGVELERRYERPILSGLHAGASARARRPEASPATAAAAAGTSVRAHFAAVAAVGLVTALAATTVLVREPAATGSPRSHAPAAACCSSA